MSASPEFDFESIARAALAQWQDLLPRWLPAGRLRGREFRVGDLNGNAGESLSVNTTTGEWADFATDERGGDLISLFAAINRLSQIDAAKQLSAILGGAPQTGRMAHVTPIRTPESPEWDGIFPVPAAAPPPPPAHPQHGVPVHRAEYRDTADRLLALVYRCEPVGQRKQVVPLTFCRSRKTGRTEWRWQSLPKPRSLYRAELLPKFLGAPVLLVEGEPKCDAANAALPENWIALSWSNGAKSWATADWSILARREVVIWPDADMPGREAAKQIAAQLPHYGATVRVLDPPASAPQGWDIGDAIRDGWDSERLMAFITPPPARQLWYSDAAWVEADIPKRQWLAKGYIERGRVTLVAGAGAAGKSSLLKAWAIACVFNVNFHRFAPIAPLRVLSYNVEDDLDEERRRLSAALRHFNRVGSDLGENLRIVGPHDVGTLIERDQNSGKLRLTEAMIELIALIEEFRPDLIMLDPMVELHTSEENDNTGLRAVVAQLRAIAVRFNAGMIIAHHVRKGAITPGDPDGVRGAGAIVGAARNVFTLCGMSEQEAIDLGISKETRKFYFRLDGAKINNAPILDAEWFERVAYQLDNGEDVAAAVPWKPPADAITTDDLESIKESICKGFDGDAYMFRKGAARSLCHLCASRGISTDVGVKQVAEMLRSSGFAEHPFRELAHRNLVKGIRAPDGRPTHVKWVEEAE